jgi:hypothetical protein
MGRVDWTSLAQDRGKVKKSCECSNETSGSINCCEVLEWLHNR